jgi:hypothetical protein
MSGERQPHRKMAADGARTENAYSHVRRIPVGGSTLSFHKLAPQRNPQCHWHDLAASIEMPHPAGRNLFRKFRKKYQQAPGEIRR